MPSGDKEEEHTFFGFRMRDRNSNEIDLSEFKNKDLVIVINCLTLEEADERSALYYGVEDQFEKRVQILCLLGSKFFYDGHQDDDSQRLISFLKEKTNCNIGVEDTLTFAINNRAHKNGSEKITCIGRNLTSKQISEEINKILN